MVKPTRIPVNARAHVDAPKVARQVVKQRVRAAVQYWEQVARRDKPRVEDIHQLRVWCRRSIAALQLFAPLLNSQHTEELSRILNKARKRAGPARDYDVLLKTLDKSSRTLLRHALALFRERREEAAAKLRKAYRKQIRSGKVRDLLRELLKTPAATAKQNGKAPRRVEFGPWFQRQFAAVVVPFRKLLLPAKPSLRGIHPLRIEGKRVRYALEIGLPALPEPAGAELYAALESLQEQLGQICDHQAHAQQYRDLAKELPPAQRRSLIAAAKRHDQEAKVGYQKFVRWWSSSRGRKQLLRFLTAACTPPTTKVAAAPRKSRQRRKSQ
jgi:CHAD domain-containing protein